MADMRKVVVVLLFVSPLLSAQHIFDKEVSAYSQQEFVPVLLWEPSNGNSLKGEENAALAKLESHQYENFLLKNVLPHKPTILLFTEENLSLEDFSLESSVGVKVYTELSHFLDTSATKLFIPSVHNPLTFIDTLKKKGYKYVKYTEETQLPNLESETYIIHVSLNDLLDTESRPQMLQRHDHMIVKVYQKILQSHGNILAMYTARFASWSESEVHHRVRRLLQTPVKDLGNGTIIVDKDGRAMLFVSSPPVLNISGSPIELKKPSMTSFDERNKMQRLIVTYSEPQKIILRFRFYNKSPGYWSFGEVEVVLPNNTDVLSRKIETVPFNFSYHCSAYDTIFQSNETRLILKNFQVQGFLSKPKFSEAYDCVYFFTIPILSGIFVTSFLAIIMAWGLCMILDIKTMDRFDDPKGKTISINVSEN